MTTDIAIAVLQFHSKRISHSQFLDPSQRLRVVTACGEPLCLVIDDKLQGDRRPSRTYDLI